MKRQGFSVQFNLSFVSKSLKQPIKPLATDVPFTIARVNGWGWEELALQLHQTRSFLLTFIRHFSQLSFFISLLFLFRRLLLTPQLNPSCKNKGVFGVNGVFKEYLEILDKSLL